MSKKAIINSLLLIVLFQTNGFALANDATEPNRENVNPETLYVTGLAHHENKNYDKAIEDLKIAVEIEPDVAKYHHILAVSYGRQAEKVNWFKAMDYAKKTLLHLEKANELDPNNLEIMDDLMDYYHEAPSFLGGDTKKGDEIEAAIEKLTKEKQKLGKK